MVELDKIRCIATDVRYWVEGRAQSDQLAGWCAIASVELFKRLREEKIDAELHVWTCSKDGMTSHVYCLVGDYIVDVTATQFHKLRDVPVFIMHQREAIQYHFYHTVAVYTTAEKFVAYQKKSKWPHNQIAYSSKTCMSRGVAA